MQGTATKPTTYDAYSLLHRGSIALARVEANGIRVDEGYLDQAITKCNEEISSLQSSLEESEEWRVWKKQYKGEANMGSREQLANILFGVLKHPYPSEDMTATGKWSTEEHVLRQVESSFVQDYLKLAKVKTFTAKSLVGLKREIMKGYLHSTYNLHTVQTYRSSSGADKEDAQGGRDYNFQNIPIRNPLTGQTIRRCFIPRRGRVLAEIDFSGIEVRISCAYHKDPTLINYVKDPTTDMHRDTAMDLFMLESWQVGKKTTRDYAKNRWVFPEFYGSVYFQCAPHIWEGVVGDGFRIETRDGTQGLTIQEHLASKGIKSLGDCDPKRRPRPGTFEARCKEAEAIMWGERFAKYTSWKRRWWEKYKERGYFDLKTGFRISGVHRRNVVLNAPIQGCLQAGSRVLTRKGWTPIEELVEVDTEVWTGFKWASAIGLNRGVCQLAEIKLSSGLVIKCDTRHKLKNEKDEWIDFASLQVGQFVALPRIGEPVEPSLDVNWWFVLGFIIGDGCISGGKQKRKNLTITVGKTKFQDLLRIKEFLQEHGYKEQKYRGLHWKVIPGRNGKSDKYQLSIQNKGLSDFLESMGLVFGWKSHTKRVPESVWRASIQEQRDFLEGLWKSDGGRNKSQKRFLHMCNLQLLRDVQILCSAVGFDAILDKHSEEDSAFWLRVHWKEQGKITPRKYPWEAINHRVEDVVRSRYEVGNEATRDQWNFTNKQSPSQTTAERMLEHNAVEGTTTQVYRYDRIESITILEGKGTTYTMSVDDPLHQFVADGVVHKNSAFHCLLLSIIEIDRRIRKGRLKTKIVGQIHDSLVVDIPPDEIETVLNICHDVMVNWIPQQFPWINVPLEVEAEVSEVDGNWWKKEKYSFAA